MESGPETPEIGGWLRANRRLGTGGRAMVTVPPWRRKRSALLLLVALFLALLLGGLRNWVG